MPLILSSLPPTKAHTLSAAPITPRTSPGRLNIASIENRLFGRPADAPVVPACPRGAQHAEFGKRVQFAELAVVETFDNSFSARTARVGVDLKALSASQCLTEYGDSLRASAIKDQLLMCVNLNRDGKFVSEGSEALLRKAFFRADKLSRKEACGPGDYSYDVLSVFLAVVEKSRPDLLTAD